MSLLPTEMIQLPSWLTWDRWYVKAGTVVAAVAGLTFVGWAHEKVVGAPPAKGQMRGGPAGFPMGMPPGFLDAGGAELGFGSPMPSKGPAPGGAGKKPPMPSMRGARASGAAPRNPSRSTMPSETQYEMKLDEFLQKARMAKRAGDIGEAEQNYQAVIDLVKRVAEQNPAEKARLVGPYQELADLFTTNSRPGSAEQIFRELVDIFHEQVALMPANMALRSQLVQHQLHLSQLLTTQGKLSEAQHLLEEVLDAASEDVPANEMGSLSSIFKRLLTLCLNQGLYEKCEQLCDTLEGFSANKSVTNNPDLFLGGNRIQRGLLRLRQKRLIDAQEIFDGVLAMYISAVPSTNQQKLTEISLRKAIAQYYSEEGHSDLAQTQLRFIFDRYQHFLDGGKLTSEEPRAIRSMVYEALNDLISELHNNEKDDAARSLYEHFISRKCAVLSQSKLLHTLSAKVMYDIAKTPIEALMLFKLLFVRDPADVQKPHIPAGALLEITYDSLSKTIVAPPQATASSSESVAPVTTLPSTPESSSTPSSSSSSSSSSSISASNESVEAVPESSESISIESTESTSTESTSTESTSTESTESTSTESTESTSIEAIESTSTEATESTSTEATESTSIEATESNSTEATESTSTESTPIESTSTESSSTDSSLPVETSEVAPSSTSVESSSQPAEASEASASPSSSSSAQISTPVEPSFVSNSCQIVITQAMLDFGRITIEFPRELESHEHIYNVGITVYSDESKSQRIGFHHQLVNCLVDTDSSPDTLKHSIDTRQLRYSPTPGAIIIS